MPTKPFVLSEKQKTKLPRIYAYGLEKNGFGIRQSEVIIDKDKAIVEFISMSDKRDLDNAVGVIVPSGIFEKFEIEPNYAYHIVKVRYNSDLMLQREREIINLLQKGGWACFLVQKIVDTAQDEYRGDKDCSHTDLTKVFMNSFGIKREPIRGSAAVSSVNDEFNEYIKNWGIALQRKILEFALF